MTVTPRHQWIEAPRRSQRARTAELARTTQELTPVVDAHRRLRGPYTAAGTIARALVPLILETAPGTVTDHTIELLTVAPELRGTVPATRETLTSLAVPEERTRFYSRLRTLRIAHGLAEFLRDHAANAPGGPYGLTVENVHAADATDRELLAVLLRRIDPALLRLTLCGAPDGAEAAEGTESLAEALERHAERVEPLPLSEADTLVLSGSRDLAWEYIASDCTDDTPALKAAYHALPLPERAALHDRRAAELEATGEASLLLGAVPYHREHGTDPAGVGVRALRTGLDTCIDTGFYEATVDFGRRGRALVDQDRDRDQWWAFTTKMTTSLAALSRPEEAEALYDEARALCADPAVHLQAAYATAMLYTRHHGTERRDHQTALGWINEAIALSTLLPDERQRAFHTVFHQNGLALIENHLGRPEEALRLVTEGLARLERELGPDEHRLHRSVLRYNRAQVYAGLGRLDEALDDFTDVIAEDPNYPEYHFDRAGVLRRLGRDDEALTEYETAMRLSPPFPELYYNRGDLRAARGNVDGALADFAYVLDIEPRYVDAHVNLAGLLVEIGDTRWAAEVVAAGLAVDPANAYLLCLLGRLESEAGHADRARAALDAAVAADPRCAEALATRAVLSFETGDLPGAVEDFSRSLEIAQDPVVLFNRGSVHEELGRWKEAAADFDRVVELDPEGPDGWLRRGACRLRLGDEPGGRSDLRRFTALAPERAPEAVALGAPAGG
ncbi:tetratricopeptide repeat protein [Streptomyces sp. PTM05]|uniref:Tetratricopeptide repeat protein n=1 Tax=Streptantibioticus parmotrematis TaxID=2873249 RepID=A0ABS7QK76_9ACTN|nr:tetratricopeptide repeat protein [Streptantibioticus parmotrematis]MBY8883587.1 tetratricopeptide repeat protein [Streptantibioticus parmotrematis]